MITQEAYNELLAANKQLQEENAELSSYRDETVWRLTEEDFISVLIDDYNLEENREEIESKEETQQMLKHAKDRFSIDDWSEWVEVFLQVNNYKE